jgi:thiamine kinase-like enzyme
VSGYITLEHGSVLDVPSLRLTHADLHCNNMLFETDTVAALLDFDDAKLGDPLIDLHYFADLIQTQYWGALGQGQDDLFCTIARSYPEPFDDLAVTKFKVISLLEATYGFAPADRSPVDDLLESNLRYSAVFEESRYERFIDLLS